MSDDETPVERQSKFGPIDHTQLRLRNERLRAEAEAAWVAREKAETAAMLADISAAAERQLAAFRDLPCRGEVAKVGACSDDFAAKCDRRTTPSCPRLIIAYDAEKHAEAEQERLAISGVPSGIRKVLLGAFEVTESVQAVDAWLASGKLLLLLAGTFGTGKSVAAGYAIKRSPGRWMHASEIAKAGRFENADRLRELQRARLLVVDDIGSEYNDASGWGKSALTDLLLVRFENGLRTILTSNLDAKAWKTYADPRIVDRLAAGTVFGAVGKSRRR